MNGESGTDAILDLRAVGMGVLWGLGILLLAAALQGMVSYRSPLSLGMESIMAVLWQGIAAAIGGLVSARRAAGSGWLHGGLTGLMLMLTLGALMGIMTALPGLAAFARMVAIGAASGLTGGIAGVNLWRK